MKIKFFIITLLIVSSLSAAATEQSIQSAKAKYAAGNPSEAITILDSALKSDPANLQIKRILADICVDTGEREYDARNFKNAYEYFRKAVQVLPTHPIATERYWKMRKEFDVNNLKNEGGSIAAKSDSDTLKPETELSADSRGTSNIEKTRITEEKQVIKRIESNPRLADELYTKKIFEMEERFNSRLLEVNSQINKAKTADVEKTGIHGVIYTIVTDTRLIIISIITLLIMLLLAIASALFAIRFLKKRIAARRGAMEYKDLFEGDNSRNYNELIKMQNIKDLLNKIKSGELDWNTIKRSIGEMDRELRLEIFSYIESKSDTYQQPITMGQADILMSLLLDGDEYIRRRASSFVSAQLSQPAGIGLKALPYMQGELPYNRSVAQITDQTGMPPQSAVSELIMLHDLNIVLPLSKIVDRKVFNDNHATRVGVDAYDMAGLLGLSQDDCTLFYIAGLLHDIGYLDIPSHILNNKSSLTEKEFEIIKRHTNKGIDLLDFTEIPQLVHDGILYHHEKWNGEGYPEGLAGEEIPLVARVICIFDMYEALILPRPQRPPFPQKEALRIIKKGAGNLFDPALVKIFDRMVKDNLVSREKIWKD